MHDECQIFVPFFTTVYVVVFSQMKGDCYQMLYKKPSRFILYCSIDELYVIYNNKPHTKEWSNLHLRRCGTRVLGPLALYVSQIGKLCEK